MKFNNKILALLIIFIAVVSISAVSAEEVAADDVVAAPVDDIAVVEASSDADNVLAASHDIPADASVSDIESIIANTTAGDTINFAENATYDFGNITTGVKIDHTLILEGNGATIKGYQGFSIEADEESVAGTQVRNLNFEMTNPILWNGRALEFFSGSDYLIEDCSFKNGNSGIYIRRPSGNVTIQNNYFFADEGATNASTITGDFAKQETGAKAINLMGGSGIKIIGNEFEGDYLDAISIASGAANVELYDNIVTDVWYGVFYGGGITNITMEGNTFENSKAYALGIIKAAGDSDIYENTFITPEGKTAIYVEEGNTAHGAPSNIETILIHDNKFYGEDSVAVSSSSKGGMITPLGEFTVIDNAYGDGVTVFEFNDNNTYSFTTNSFVTDNNVTIEGNVPIVETNIIFINEDKKLTSNDLLRIMLIGEDNVILGNQDINIKVISGGNVISDINTTTSEQGLAEIPLIFGAGTYTINVTYDGEKLSALYLDAENSTSIDIITNPAIIVGKNVTIPTKAKQRFEITLKDNENKLLTNQTVQFTVNGVTYNRTTDENGIAGLNINLNMGDYPMTVTYNNGNTTVTETYTLTAIQSNTTIKSTPVTFEGKGNRFEAQLVDQLGQPIADTTVAFHINGVTYYRVTDSEGKFYLNINLNPGIYNMYMSFDGTFLYAASNGGSQVTVV